jgi:FMN phosphatase YigB (HAD superfamily)/DNA-binding XRE family transcriptional regulator
MDEQALGKKLQDARRKAGLTQQQLCQKAGLSYSTLAKIERGAIKSPSVFTVAAIAKATGARLEELLDIQPVPTIPEVVKKRSINGVSFVFIDLNGVLVRFFHRAFSQIAEEAAVGADIVETLFWRHNDAACRGELSLHDFNNIFAGELGMPEFDWKKYYMASVDPMPHIGELVSWIADHYKIGILTNSMPGFVKELRENGRIPDIAYDVIIDSSEVQAVKPEPQIYQAAQAKAGVEPGEILLIDDGRTNLMAADRLGWHVLWFDDFRPEESLDRARQALQF